MCGPLSSKRGRRNSTTSTILPLSLKKQWNFEDTVFDLIKDPSQRSTSDRNDTIVEHILATMAGDKYIDTLNEMITMFKNYKPGMVTLDNITKLCQTLGLESFIDDVDDQTARLSTASKIIVIDIDFDKSEGRVKDVKLVLASNFDNFNYFERRTMNDTQHQDNENNILLKSLVDFTYLNEFHENLEFLYLLDSYSQLDTDTGGSANGSVLHGNTTTQSETANSSLVNQANVSSNSPLGVNSNPGKSKLDLFKYFTELSGYLQDYFNDNSISLKIATNLNSRFGIYILSDDADETVLAKLTFKKSLDPQKRLYEYIYSKEHGEWINESAESYTTGVSLVMEVLSDSKWFPRTFISSNLIFGDNAQHNRVVPNLVDTTKANTTEVVESSRNPSRLLQLLTKIDNGDSTSSGAEHSAMNNHLYYHDKVQLINDFTSPLVKVPFFNLSNASIDLVYEILKWILWSTVVLEGIVDRMSKSIEAKKVTFPNVNGNHSLGFNSIEHYRSNSIVGTAPADSVPTSVRRRRSSNKAKRPSITEATMLKDEGMQQFSLQEVMKSQSVFEDDNLEDADNIDDPMGLADMDPSVNATSDSIAIGGDSRLDIDPMELGNDIEERREETAEKAAVSETKALPLLVISEDHISLGEEASCNLYEVPEKWTSFIKKFEKYI